MKLLAVWVVIVLGCGDAKSEQGTEQSGVTPKPAVMNASNDADATEARRSVARQNNAGDVIARTSGFLDTVLEIASKTQGCNLEILRPIADRSGPAMAGVGFKMLKCIDSNEHIDLGSNPTSAPVDAGIPIDAPVLIETTAGKLFSDYTNEVAGDLKYRGRVIRLTGRILRIAKDPLSTKPFIALAAGPYGMNEVHAYITDPHDVIERKRGEQVRLLCIGDGTLMSLIPRLKGCEVEAWR